VPPLKRNPVFLYASDRFQRPNPFRADVAVGIDDVMDPTLDALLLMKSQIQEGGADGNASLYPENDPAARQKRDADVRANLARRYASEADRNREALIKFYGAEKGRAIKYAQAYEVCEYGRQPSVEDLKKLMPF
jgi:N-acetylglucosamine malate deacetylase 1